MAHLFISYSRKDIDYVRRVVESLLERGFDVWFDAQIDYGDNWESAIFNAIDESAALIVIMSPEAAASAWVPREIAYAESRGKPVFPLLLKGEVFPRLILTQFADVRSAALPNAEFYAAIAKVTTPRSGRGQEIHIAAPAPQGVARTPPGTAVQERRLESAMPRQSGRGIPTEVRVKISQIGTSGLRGELPDLTEYGDEIRKDDVRGASFPLTFPRDKNGALLSINACIHIESEQYAVQYPPNACGEGAAEVEIQPAHDTRTIIFTLVPKTSSYLGRCAVTVRLLVDGRVIAENLVVTRILEEVVETAFVLASASLPAVGSVERSAPSAPTRPVATVELSKTAQSSAPTVPIHIEKRVAAGQPVPTTPRMAPAAAPQAEKRPRKSGGGLLRYGGLLGIVLAGMVGVLVLQMNSARFGEDTPPANSGIQPTYTVNSSTGVQVTALPADNVIRARARGDASDTPHAFWTGDPVAGLTQAGTISPGTQLVVLSKAQIAESWYVEVITPDHEGVWMAADAVSFADDTTLEDIQTWAG